MEETCSRSGLPLWTRRRASTPKTKTGCLTCRQRRVKCDEAKPECMRCSKYGRECLGYQTNKTRHLRALRPAGPDKMLADDVLPSQPLSAPPVFNPQQAHYRTPRLIVPSGVTFVNEDEFRYFCYFRDETAAELSAGFDPSLWNQIVLQACDSRAILQLMTAVAALSLANRSGNQDVQASDRDENNQYAFQQYGEGLRNMREAVATSSDSVRTFLIGTLLIFCFEGLQDNSVGAIVHISSALDIVLNHISAEPEKYRYSRLRAPRTRVDNGINDQVIMAYVRLETKSLPIQNHNVSYFEPRIAPVLFANTHIEIPTCFGTIPEARMYLEAIKRQAPLYTERPKFAMRGSQENVNQLEISEMESFGVTLDKCYDEGPGPVADGQLTRWHDAFSPLLRYAMSSAGEPIFIGAVTLYVQALAENLQACQTTVEPGRSASVSQPGSPGSPYNHNIDGTSNAHVIVALCRQLIGHPKFNKGFVFDIGIIPSVAKIFATSPEYSLREEAVEILRLMRPRREAFWDSRALTEIAEGLLSEREIFHGSSA